jgi:hypothetical protein
MLTITKKHCIHYQKDYNDQTENPFLIDFLLLIFYFFAFLVNYLLLFVQPPKAVKKANFIVSGSMSHVTLSFFMFFMSILHLRRYAKLWRRYVKPWRRYAKPWRRYVKPWRRYAKPWRRYAKPWRRYAKLWRRYAKLLRHDSRI